MSKIQLTESEKILAEKAIRSKFYKLKTIEECVDAAMCERSFYHFVKKAWPYAVGGHFTDGKHIEMVCRHLQKVTEGEILNLIICMSPRSSKSSLVNVLWPAWEWTIRGKESMTYCGFSHSKELVLEHMSLSKELIRSPWYQDRWGDRWQLSKTQDAKGNFKNTLRGHRKALVISGAVGFGADRMIFDDLLDASDLSLKGLEAVVTFWKNAISARVNDRTRTAKILIMQRLHENDIVGWILENDKHNNWIVLNLPAEFEVKNKFKTPYGEDWRTKEGELLWPEHWGKTADGKWDVKIAQSFIDNQKKTMGPYVYSCQFQQRPTPADGGIFLKSWWKFYDWLPKNHLQMWFSSWDLAIKEKDTADYTVGGVWCYYPDFDHYYLVDVVRHKIEYVAQKLLLQQISYKYPDCIAHVIEDKANGGALISEFTTGGIKIKGHVLPYDPKGVPKEVRMRLASTTMQAGKVFLPRQAPWLADYLHELETVPKSSKDDQADMTAQAILWNSNKGFLPGTELVQIMRPGMPQGGSFTRESLFSTKSKMPKFY